MPLSKHYNLPKISGKGRFYNTTANTYLVIFVILSKAPDKKMGPVKLTAPIFVYIAADVRRLYQPDQTMNQENSYSWDRISSLFPHSGCSQGTC